MMGESWDAKAVPCSTGGTVVLCLDESSSAGKADPPLVVTGCGWYAAAGVGRAPLADDELRSLR